MTQKKVVLSRPPITDDRAEIDAWAKSFVESVLGPPDAEQDGSVREEDID